MRRAGLLVGIAVGERVAGIGGGQYPSTPVVQAAGCWTLTEKIGQRTAGAVTLAVRKAI